MPLLLSHTLAFNIFIEKSMKYSNMEVIYQTSKADELHRNGYVRHILELKGGLFLCEDFTFSLIWLTQCMLRMKNASIQVPDHIIEQVYKLGTFAG